MEFKANDLKKDLITKRCLKNNLTSKIKNEIESYDNESR